MRKIVEEYTVYEYNELSEAAKEKATGILGDRYLEDYLHFDGDDLVRSMEAFLKRFESELADYEFAPYMPSYVRVNIEGYKETTNEEKNEMVEDLRELARDAFKGDYDLTGVFTDDYIMLAIKEVEEDINFNNMTRLLEEIPEVAVKKFLGDLEKNSEDGEFLANAVYPDVEFLEDGTIYKG